MSIRAIDVIVVSRDVADKCRFRTVPSSDPAEPPASPRSRQGTEPGLGGLTPEMGPVAHRPTGLPSGFRGRRLSALGATSGSVTGRDKGGWALLATGRGRQARSAWASTEALVAASEDSGTCGASARAGHPRFPGSGSRRPEPLAGAWRFPQEPGAAPPPRPGGSARPPPRLRKSPCPQQTRPRCRALGGFSWTVLEPTPPATAQSESTPGPEAPLAEEGRAQGRDGRGPVEGLQVVTELFCFLQAEALHLLQAAPESHQRHRGQ